MNPGRLSQGARKSALLVAVPAERCGGIDARRRKVAFSSPANPASQLGQVRGALYAATAYAVDAFEAQSVIPRTASERWRMLV